MQDAAQHIVIDVHGLTKVVRRPRGGARPLHAGQARHHLRLPRSQRQRQDHHHPHAVRPAHARRGQRHAASASTSVTESDKIKRAGRLHDAALQPLRGPVASRENLEFVARIYWHARPAPGRRARSIDAARAGHAARTSWPANCPAAGSSAWRSAPALLPEPKLLLLDEPTAGVDPKARRDFWNEIHALAAEGLTVLVSTHYMDEAERCHEIAYIAYGELLARGTVDEVIARSASGDLHRQRRQGDGLNELPDELAGKPGVDMVAPFGTSLHVSGRDGPRSKPRSRPVATQGPAAGSTPRRRSRTCSSI